MGKCLSCLLGQGHTGLEKHNDPYIDDRGNTPTKAVAAVAKCFDSASAADRRFVAEADERDSVGLLDNEAGGDRESDVGSELRQVHPQEINVALATSYVIEDSDEELDDLPPPPR